jgi:hypothetical protein
LKKTVAILLTLLIFLQPFGKIWIFVSFKINQDYIAKNLCENRAKPIMRCNGKCQLMKKLNQADKDEQKQFPSTIKEKSEFLYCHNLTNFRIHRQIYFFDKKQSFFDYKFQYSSSYLTEIFRPPKFSLI